MALEILRQKPPVRFLIEPLRILGMEAGSRGRYSAAAYYFRRGLALERRQPRYGAEVRLSVASLAIDQGEFRIAHLATEDASAIYRKRLDLPAMGRTLQVTGRIYVAQGKVGAGREACRGALELLDPSDWIGRFCTLQVLGMGEVYAGNLRAAKASLAEAMTVLKDQAHAPKLEAWSLWLTGEIALEEGDLAGAGRAFSQLEASFLDQKDWANSLCCQSPGL